MTTMLTMPNSDADETEILAVPTHRPRSIAEIDVRQSIFLRDLALKILSLSGTLSVLELAAKTRLSVAVVTEQQFHGSCSARGGNGNLLNIAGHSSYMAKPFRSKPGNQFSDHCDAEPGLRGKLEN